MEPLRPPTAFFDPAARGYGMDLSTKAMISQPGEWIPLVDWFAGMMGACIIAALLWVAIAIA
jgi:hypothetical protein